MIELIYILRVFVEVACGGERGENHQKKCILSIKFSQLEKLIFDELWQKKRIAIYSTSWEMRRDLERLADLDIVKYEYESDEIKIPEEFLKKIEPFLLVTKNLVAGNAYLKYVFKEIEDGTRRYVAENILVPQPA